MANARFFLACLALGAIGHFGSEALFWTAPPEDLGWVTIPATIGIYALAASVGLAAVMVTGCTGWTGLFLGGALMGFSVEGAAVSTMYDAFPVQLVWTPLAWHALLTAGVILGLARVLARGGLVRQVAGMALAGIGFGIWGGYWPVERAELVTAAPWPTLAYLAGSGLLAACGQIALDRLQPLARPSRAVLLVGPGLAAALWLVGSVAAPAPQRLAGPVMAGLTFWAMMRLGRRPAGPLALPVAPAWRHLVMLVLPVTASLVAVALWHNLGPVESNWPVAILSGLAGLGLWLRFLWRGYRSAASAAPRSSAPS